MKLLVVEGNNAETRGLRGSSGIMPYHLLFKEMLQFLEPSAQVISVFPADDSEPLPSDLEGMAKYHYRVYNAGGKAHWEVTLAKYRFFC